MLEQRSSYAFLEYLINAAIVAPSADNSQPFRFVWDGRSLDIAFDHVRCGAGIFGKNDHPTLLALGAVLDNLDQAATAANVELRLTWLPDDSTCYVSIEFIGFFQQKLPGQLPLYGRHTNRFPFETTPVPKSALCEFSGSSAGRLVEFRSGCSQHDLIRLTRIAAEVRFQNESLHDWLIGSLRSGRPNGETSRDGLDMATLNLPPGGDLFMKLISDWKRMRLFNRFGLYKALASIEVQLLARAPLILALVGGKSNPDIIGAGRLLNRIWTGLNEKGLAVHPYYVLVDQLQRLDRNFLPNKYRSSILNVKRSVDDLIALAEGEQLHMMLRVGYPKKQPPRSGRLLVKDVLTFA